MKRTLVLKSETLTELTASDLHAVVGGQDTSRCASRDCQTMGLTCSLSYSERICVEPGTITGANCA